MLTLVPSARLSVIFPIGEKRRGPEFRAFTTVAGETLIHRAWRSFAPYAHLIDKVYLIYSADDEHTFGVSRRLAEELRDVAFETILLAEATAGPSETMARGVAQHGIGGRAIVCDIDHRLDLRPLFEAIDEKSASPSIACVWPIKGENLKRWSVAALRQDGTVRAVAERRLPATAGRFFGVIGCHYFAGIEAVAGRCLEKRLWLFSALLNDYAENGAAIPTVRLETGEFFGDKERIDEIESGRTKFCGTIFCDIDGTILSHEDIPDYSALCSVLPGSIEKLTEWVSDGYYVVLCTARASKDEAALTAALHRLEIPFHRLITGLPSGPRVVINDRKPYAMFSSQALSLEISRNQGISTLALPQSHCPTVLRRFEGGSFAETLLLEDNAHLFVRKLVSKHSNLEAGYVRLKRQFNTLSRFAQLSPGIVPQLHGEKDNSHEYYYDMEYLGDHEPLSECDAAVATAALDTLLQRFDQDIYCHRNRSASYAGAWFLRHLETKIFSKMDALCANARLRPLIMDDGVEIDGIVYPGVQRLMASVLRKEVLPSFSPRFLSAVHGDMTFQNIMVSADGAAKVIDLESTDALEAVELDLGKNFQSIFSQYDTWSLEKSDLCTARSGTRLSLNFVPREASATMMDPVLRRWSEILDCSPELADLKGRFYLGLHLFRMVPFRLRVSEDQALYALATSLQWLSRAVSEIRDGRGEDKGFGPGGPSLHAYGRAG